jgi:RHS repeat-associated protein
MVVSGLPGQGARLWTYDAANRLLLEQRLDRNAQVASRVRSRYDAAGRLTERVIEDAQRKTVQSALRRYDGVRLAEETDDTQTRRFGYDEAGRVSQTTVVLRDDKGLSVFKTTLRTRYDPATGEPSARTLADSQVMGIERRETDQTAQRITLQSAFWDRVAARLDEWLPASTAIALQRWLPKTDVVHDINFHPYNGIVGYTQGNGMSTLKSFDIAGRMTALKVGGQGHVTVQSLGYDIGPRIRTLAERATGPLFESRYDYTGFGALKSDPVAAPMRTAFSDGATTQGIERDAQGRAAGDGTLRYGYTANGQLETITSADGKVVATYRYDANSQRVSKTLASGQTTYFLWQDGKVVAEIEGSGGHRGEITVQYLYLSDSGKVSPIAKIEAAHAEGNATGAARMLFVQVDFRGEPSAMTDDRQRVVWQARADSWGFIKTQGLEHQVATMNLRLPGQYFDAESGLHDNWHRSYDGRPGSATHGSYLSPDPIGYPDGPDAYRYVNGDPINKVDPTGLYEEDVHYYMTYFLALVSGLPDKQAQTVAAADRYIDDNPNTEPYAGLTAREYYHFTQSGWDSTTDPGTRYLNPKNPQLTTLHEYGTSTNGMTPARDPTPCARAQLYGEFLHAYEDTYAHRDQNNDPYGATLGHLSGGHNPDQTFNHVDAVFRNWARTLAMETAVFGLFHTDFGLEGKDKDGFPIVWVDIQATMTKFNQTNETEQNSTFTIKKQVLDDELAKLGLPQMSTYNCSASRDARNNNLKDVSGNPLDQGDYVGTILKTPTAAQPCK